MNKILPNTCLPIQLAESGQAIMSDIHNDVTINKTRALVWG